MNTSQILLFSYKRCTGVVMAIWINTDNFMGNGYKINAKDWTQCSDIHYQACLFFSYSVVDSWKLVKKYVCPQDRKKCSHKYYFCSLVLFRAFYSTVHVQTSNYMLIVYQISDKPNGFSSTLNNVSLLKVVFDFPLLPPPLQQ